MEYKKMDLNEFRIHHSTLMEHYQYIEAQLEYVYVALSEKPLLDGLKDVEKDSLHRILNEIKKLENEKNQIVFTNEEYERMKKIFERRNFWCHNCYYDMPFDLESGGPKKASDIETMFSDLREAAELRGELYKKQSTMFGYNI